MSLDAAFPLDGLARRILAGAVQPSHAAELSFAEQLGLSLRSAMDAALSTRESGIATLSAAKHKDGQERQRQRAIRTRQAQMASSLEQAKALNNIFEAHALGLAVSGVVKLSDDCDTQGISLAAHLTKTARHVANQLGMPAWYHSQQQASEPEASAEGISTQPQKRPRPADESPQKDAAVVTDDTGPDSKRAALPESQPPATATATSAAATSAAAAATAAEAETSTLFGGGFQGDFASDDEGEE